MSDPQRRQQYDLKFQQQSARKQKPQANASSSSRTYRRPDPPPFTKKQPPPTPPFVDPNDETLEDLLSEVEGLMEKFGVKFRDPLDVLVEWALKVFEELASAWKEDEPKTFQQSERPKKERKSSMFEEIEEEFQKLKNQQRKNPPRGQGGSAQTKSPPKHPMDRELKELKKKYGKSS